MSDQETGTGVILDLEGLFLSREFGRRPARTISSAPATVASQPAQLEQVFLSEVFGHPEVVAAATLAVAPGAPATASPASLVLLKGGAQGSSDHDRTPSRAIAAVSGVAAAAVVVAGLASGPGHEPGRPSVPQQAQGVAATPDASGPGAISGPGPAGANVPLGQPGTGSPVLSGGGATNATFASFSAPASSTTVTQGTTGSGAATPASPAPPNGGASPPGAPPGSGDGGSLLTPTLNVVGNEVSSVGSSVTSTSSDVGQALPVSSVVQALGSVATSAMNNLGGGSPPNILAGTSN